MRRLIHGVNVAIAILAGAGIIVFTLMTTIEVVRRYLFNAPSSWAFEVSEYLLVFCAFLGMAYTLQLGAHVRVDIVYRRYPKRRRLIADSISAVFILIFWCIVTWMSTGQAIFYLTHNIKSETLLGTPLFYPMMFVVVGSLFCCFQSLLMIYDAVVALRNKGARDGSGLKAEPVGQGEP